MTDLPGYYFRVRENGGTMYRIGDETRHRRVDLEQVAVINTRNGEIRGSGNRPLAPEDRVAAETWLTERRALLAARRIDDIHRAIDHMNLTAQWVQSQASPDELEAVTDPLLLAMHDLRSILVRRKADRVEAARTGTDAPG
ncbi:hypothetical protein [Limimaricola hongkongensis]|uniref:Uncharacterized protein n=1 Tax=Limimaricola hongkongensis DSM 17492 TaxID=1122180 RepID=A0A017H9R8_9RHOB|nr:hypothetical protein [Limimaricola hongkongensis]EYD71030.1 hypothetical protein Lokhon_02675 [Limimaricola hongkongensis DSM 17492]